MQTDFIIALAWPEGMVSACGSWYDIFFARNKKYRVGHSALALVDSVSGKLRYFDFGRYHAPKDFGRVREMLKQIEMLQLRPMLKSKKIKSTISKKSF